MRQLVGWSCKQLALSMAGRGDADSAGGRAVKRHIHEWFMGSAGQLGGDQIWRVNGVSYTWGKSCARVRCSALTTCHPSHPPSASCHQAVSSIVPVPF